MNYTIREARPSDLSALSAIELAAAKLLDGHAPHSILEVATSQETLEHAQREGLLLVAVVDELPVGFALLKPFGREVLHLDELDVHPDHGRRGVGARLVAAAVDVAALGGFDRVTLSTFRDVPWNRPFYAKMGFNVIPPADLSPELRAVVENEKRRGLDVSRRVVMQRHCARRR